MRIRKCTRCTANKRTHTKPSRSPLEGLFLCPFPTYGREAILSRFKRLSLFGWYQYTTYGSYALKRALKCLSAPPLVGCGVLGLAWVCVWAWFVRPLLRTHRGTLGCGARIGARSQVRTPTQARSYTCTRLYLRTLVRTNAQTCAHVRSYTHPRMRPPAFGHARAHAPIYI